MGPGMYVCPVCKQTWLAEHGTNHVCPGPPVTLADIKALLEKVLQKVDSP